MSGDSGLRSILPQLATGTTAQKKKNWFWGVNSDAMYMAIFLGGNNPLDYV